MIRLYTLYWDIRTYTSLGSKTREQKVAKNHFEDAWKKVGANQRQAIFDLLVSNLDLIDDMIKAFNKFDLIRSNSEIWQSEINTDIARSNQSSRS